MISNRQKHLSSIGKGLVAVAFSFALLHAGNAYAQGPAISSLLPASTNAGGNAFTLIVSGTGFVSNSVVQWNGSTRATSFFSSSTLEAAITADDIASPGFYSVAVVNPGGLTSNALTFTVKGNTPTITSVSPSTIVTGGPSFKLTVRGTGFSNTSVVNWNSSPRATAFVDGSTLTATILASDIAQNGSATITVTDPASGEIASNVVRVTIGALALYFPQVAVGGGYSTVFTVFNTVITAVPCNLVLTDQGGNPFVTNIASAAVGLASPAPDDRVEAVGSTLSFFLQPGTIKTITVTPLNPSDPAKNGWARIEYQTGYIYGVSTYKYRPAGTLITSVGVLSSPLIGYGTIPIDNDDSQARYTGFALANPNSDSVNVRLITLDQSGNVADNIAPPQLNPLGPNQQVAVYLHQLVSRLTFKGTLILYVTNGKQLSMTALVQEQGVFSAIPVVPDKVAYVP